MFGRMFAMMVAAAVVASSLAGCDKDTAFFIYQNQVPSSGCFVSAESNLHRPNGLLDVSLGKGYELFPLLRNELPSKKAVTNVHSDDADPNVLHMREFNVRLDVTAIGQSLDSNLLEFNWPTSGTLYPGDKRVANVRVIPNDLARDIEIPAGARPTVIAEVRAIADSSDGKVESVPFFFPVELCDGCLVATLDECPADLDNPGNVCGLPQDATLICCKHPQLGLVCPGGPVDDNG